MIIDSPEQAVAKYLIQLTLTYRKNTINRLGTLHVFEKGGWFGHADQLMRWCEHGSCMGVIPMRFRLTNEQVMEIGEDNLNDPTSWPFQYQMLYKNWYSAPTVCPLCGKPCSSIESLPDSYGFNLPDDKIAEKMGKLFHQLGGDCDVYLVRNKHHLGWHKQKAIAKDASISAGQRAVQSEAQMEMLRNSREKVFYPLKTIISETGGSDVVTRFKALLGA